MKGRSYLLIIKEIDRDFPSFLFTWFLIVFVGYKVLYFVYSFYW